MGIFSKILKKESSIWDQYYNEEEKGLKFTDKTIYDFLKSKVPENHYDYPALNYFGKKISYKHLFNKIEQASKALMFLGVRQGDVVTICMPNTPEAIVSFYATNNIGAIANMVHPLSAKEEIKHYLLESKSRVLILIDFDYEKVKDILDETIVHKVILVSAKDSMPQRLKVLYQITRGYKIKKPNISEKDYIRWNDFLLASINYNKTISHNMKSTDVALILHSGGTTGTPKGILLSNFNFNAEVQQCFFNVKK